MKLAIMADLHFHAFKQFASRVDGDNSRFLEIIEAFSNAVEMAAEQECTALLIAGDVFHARGALRPSVFNRVFFEIAEAAGDMQVLIIPGNHDMENYRGGSTAVDTLHEMENVTVAKEPSCPVIVGTRSGSVRNLSVGCVPYIHDHEEFIVEAAKLVGESTQDILLIHQGIDDFADPGVPGTGLTIKRIREFFDGPVFCGHYHGPEMIDNVFCVGSLVQHSFGDTSERGFWIYDTDTKAAKHVVVPGPRFLTVSSVKEAKAASGCYVRVMASTLAKADKISNAAFEAGAKGVTVVLERKFTAAHSSALKLSTPKNMLAEYLGMQSDTKGREGELMALFEAVCEVEAEA